jgi:hypothetical protein
LRYPAVAPAIKKLWPKTIQTIEKKRNPLRADVALASGASNFGQVSCKAKLRTNKPPELPRK